MASTQPGSTARHTTWHGIAETSLGDLTVVRDATGLRGIYFPHHWHRPDPDTFGPRVDEGFDELTAQLAQYLAGERRRFDLALSPVGDRLRHRVWDLVARIPYGETTTYGELALLAGCGLTAQQVGAVVGRNPLSIVVPCHRVVGRGSKLTGYAGGIARKRRLLDLEHERAAGTPSPWGA